MAGMNSSKRTRSSGSGQVRIIGGAMRRHWLAVPPVEGLRPTPDRVRETVFNWLGQDCTGWQVLDLFAGTGALGFEAASRGAAHVCFSEQHSAAVAQLKANSSQLLERWPKGLQPPRLQVQAGDALGFLAGLAKTAQRFDLIALDPPFRSPLLQQALPLLPPLLAPGGLVYVEWHEALFDDQVALAQALEVAQIEALRHLKAGQVHAHLFSLPAL